MLRDRARRADSGQGGWAGGPALISSEEEDKHLDRFPQIGAPPPKVPTIIALKARMTLLCVRDCTGRPFLGFGLFGKITRVLGRVFGLLLVRENELICEKAYIFIYHFKAYDCYTSKSYFFFIFDRKWDLSKNKSSVDWSLSRVRSLVMNRPTAEKALWSIQVSDKIWDHREIVLNHHDLF